MSKQTVEASPNTPHFLDTYAWLLYLNKEYEQAQSFMDKSLEAYPNDEISAEIYEHAGEIYLAIGKQQTAHSFFKRALQQKPNAAMKARIQKRLKALR